MPELTGLREIKSSGKSLFFVLDSCMCLEIIKLADHKKKANVSHKLLFNFLDLVKRSKAKFFSLGGLVELCTDHNNKEIDSQKFYDFFHRIKMIEILSIKHLRNFNYDYRNYLTMGDFKIPARLHGFDDMLLPTYCCLLKLRELALKNGTKKDCMEKNLIAYLEWMDNILDIMMGVEFQLGTKIFGGDTEFRKMIHLDGKPSEAKKKIIGTAWDICHYRLFSNSENLSVVVGEDTFPVFVTKDIPFFKLVRSIFSAPVKPGTRIMIDNYDSSFESYEIITGINERMLKIADKRKQKEIIYDEVKIKKLIDDLEKTNLIV
ncbi:MAG: hypothetical protein DI588_14595 [Flavobacterium johnsoniae]|nr:MAG: hypothetical protein DI588_14595 [Flavobacterium johnsoniae]